MIEDRLDFVSSNLSTYDTGTMRFTFHTLLHFIIQWNLPIATSLGTENTCRYTDVLLFRGFQDGGQIGMSRLS